MAAQLAVLMARPVRANWWSRKPTLPRVGAMLHYDGSASDRGAIAWLEDDARARVSYNWLILDDGTVIELTREAAWHGGHCRSSDPRLSYIDANQQLYGIAIAATDGEVATRQQVDAVLGLLAYLFYLHGWSESERWRIVGHDTEAVFPAGHARAGQRGRKIDPTGSRPDRPVLSVAEVRDAFSLSRFGGVA